MTWHLGPMAAFDLETTGVDVETDRIVTACVAEIDGSGQNAPAATTWLVNPGVEIPKAASDVHGISTDRARAEGRPPVECVAEIAALLADMVEADVPVVAFNAVYDLTLLDRECRRHGVPSLADWCEDEGFTLHVVDPFVLDKHVDRYRRGKRNLTAACEHYGVRLDGAHDASFDAVAATRVAWRIAQRYPEIAEMSLPDLHALQVKACAEQAASFRDYLRSQGKPCDDVRDEWPLVPFKAGGAS